MKRLFTIILLSLSVLVITSGCALTIKPAATKSGKAYYESFLTEEGTMYFIKPIKFESSDKSNELFVDFTFKPQTESPDTAAINLSIKGDDILKTIDRITFSNSGSEVSLEDITLLFNEKKDKKITSRFSAKCPTSKLIPIMGDSNIQIKITKKDSSSAILFLPNKSSQKTIRTLNENLYILF